METLVTDHNIERLERQQTQPKLPASGSVMGLVLLLSYGVALPDQDLSPFVFKQTDPTAVLRNVHREISAIDILNVLRTVHDKMIAESHDLDSDAREILYNNLSKLYKYA